MRKHLRAYFINIFYYSNINIIFPLIFHLLPMTYDRNHLNTIMQYLPSHELTHIIMYIYIQPTCSILCCFCVNKFELVNSPVAIIHLFPVEVRVSVCHRKWTHKNQWHQKTVIGGFCIFKITQAHCGLWLYLFKLNDQFDINIVAKRDSWNLCF